MAHMVSLYYEESIGPNRNGEMRIKPAVYPQIGSCTPEHFVTLAEGVIEWGQERYRNDHGSRDDHQRLVDFVNVAFQMLRHINGEKPTSDKG